MSNTFAKIRSGIFDHIENRKIKFDGSEFGVYIMLHLRAGLDTGVVLKFSAPFLHYATGANLKKIRNSLASLEKNGYIKRLRKSNQKTFYPVLIHKYQTINNLILDAHKSLSLDNLCYRVVVTRVVTRVPIQDITRYNKIKKEYLLSFRSPQKFSSESEKKNSENSKLLFDYWNEKQNLINHKNFDSEKKDVLNQRLKDYSFDVLKECIDNYHHVLSSNSHFYSYKHTIESFFRSGNRKEAPWKKFLPEAEPISNFLSTKYKNKQETFTPQDALEQKKWMEN